MVKFFPILKVKSEVVLDGSVDGDSERGKHVTHVKLHVLFWRVDSPS